MTVWLLIRRKTAAIGHTLHVSMQLPVHSQWRETELSSMHLPPGQRRKASGKIWRHTRPEGQTPDLLPVKRVLSNLQLQQGLPCNFCRVCVSSRYEIVLDGFAIPGVADWASHRANTV